MNQKNKPYSFLPVQQRGREEYGFLKTAVLQVGSSEVQVFWTLATPNTWYLKKSETFSLCT